jgi:divalent metal cation (Fe/Co/Zn/Cd) transporter
VETAVRDPNTRESWLRWARLLAWLTILYNVVEGMVAVGFGVADESLALFGFGVDSWIEVGSAVVILWRLHGGSRAQDREKRATRAIAGLLVLLGAGMVLGGGVSLVSRGHPETTLPGIVVAVVSLLSMAFLWRWKVRAAEFLDSSAVRADAACSRACMQLSVVLFVGSVAYALVPGLWWADAVAACALGLLVGRDGLEEWREVDEESDDDTTEESRP